MKSFVIAVDTQRDFMMPDGALAVAGADALVPAAADFMRALRPEAIAGVLFTFDSHEPEAYAASPEGAEFPIHCVRGSAGWANMLDPGLVHPSIPLWRLEKGVFDMWAEDGVEVRPMRDAAAPAMARDDFFRQLRERGVERVVVIGVAADYCVKWAVEGLLARGFDVVVPAHLTRGIVRQIEAVADEDFPGARLTVERAPALAG